jgi:hypothetical protein
MSLEEFNYKLYKTSKDRFELRLSKNNRFYLYDYDDTENRLSRGTLEIKDILECMNLYDEFLELKRGFHL